jgi:malonyl-CoA decarboxylase
VVARLSQELPQLEQFATLSPISGFRKWLLTHPADSDRADLKSLRPILGDPDKFASPAALEPYRNELLRWCARYLLHAKRSNGQVEDRVEHFHLTNGARVERINWMANPSSSGMERAFGMMVNYRYDLRHIDANHERYVGAGDVAHASGVSGLL